jgi:hypothetical protein
MGAVRRVSGREWRLYASSHPLLEALPRETAAEASGRRRPVSAEDGFPIHGWPATPDCINRFVARVRVMHRGFLLSSRRSATRNSDCATWPDGFPSSGAHGVQLALSQVSSPRRATGPLSRPSHPHAVHPFILTDRFRRLSRPPALLVLLADSTKRGPTSSTSGLCSRRGSAPRI